MLVEVCAIGPTKGFKPIMDPLGRIKVEPTPSMIVVAISKFLNPALSSPISTAVILKSNPHCRLLAAMALRFMRALEGHTGSMLGFKAIANVFPHSSPMSEIIDRKDSVPPLVLPEFNHESDSDRISNNGIVEFGFPSLPFSGSMELMAVPKRKVSKHKRGIRNGPRALKPIPVIHRCRTCGKVKLPHFYCCSGRPEELENSA